jgi:hypothetical protein
MDYTIFLTLLVSLAIYKSGSRIVDYLHHFDQIWAYYLKIVVVINEFSYFKV